MSGCVDPTRIILTGESNGAAMALVAACAPQLATRFTRVVLVNAAVDHSVLQRCSNTAQAVPLTVVAGAHDETTPLEGNDNFLPVDEWFAAAASQLTACSTIESAPPLDAVVLRSVGTGCSACTELLVIADGTHTWPGTSRGVSGLVPGTFDLNAMLVGAPSTPTRVVSAAGETPQRALSTLGSFDPALANATTRLPTSHLRRGSGAPLQRPRGRWEYKLTGATAPVTTRASERFTHRGHRCDLHGASRRLISTTAIRRKDMPCGTRRNRRASTVSVRLFERSADGRGPESRVKAYPFVQYEAAVQLTTACQAGAVSARRH